MMTGSGPLVSVIIRTQAGREQLLAEALESVGAQDYRPIEVVVVEDGSTVAGETVARVAEAHGLRHRYQSLPKSGRCRAGNEALRLATGELFNFLDDDDQLYPQHLRLLVASLQEESRAVAAYARAVMIPTSVTSVDPLVYEEGPAWNFRAQPFSRWELWFQNQFPIQACVFRRELYEEHGGFDPDIPLLEDWELWARYLSDGRSVVFVDEATSMFRIPGRHGAILSREGILDDSSGEARGRIDEIEVRATGTELTDAARRMLDARYERSTRLAALWAAVDRSPTNRRVLLAVPKAILVSIRAARRRFRRTGDGTPTANALRAAARRDPDAETPLTVGEARAALFGEWHDVHADRYCLVAFANLLERVTLRIGRRLPQRPWPNEDHRRPPGATTPVSTNP